MSRSVDLWEGKNDDTVPPPRVRLRTFDRYEGRCHICGRKISAGEYWECDHVIALCNGGRNAEDNLKPACRNCCKSKTAEDVALKSMIVRKREKHLGIAGKKFKWPKRSLNGPRFDNSKDIND